MVTKNERTLYISMSKRDNKNRDFDWFPITNSEDKNERDDEFSILIKHIIHISQSSPLIVKLRGTVNLFIITKLQYYQISKGRN
jgi:hypothetical protein